MAPLLCAALVAVAFHLVSATRVGTLEPARCEVQNEAATLAFQVDSGVVWEDSVPFATLRYSIGQTPNAPRRVLSEMVPLGGGTGVETLQGDLRNVCQHPPSAREFANKFLYDLLSAAILAFAAEPSSCAAEFRDGTRFEFHYRCTEAGEDLRMVGVDETLAQYSAAVAPGTCRSPDEEWQCELGPVRRLLLQSWMRLMAFRPAGESRDMFRHVGNILRCRDGASMLDCAAPKSIRRGLAEVYARLPGTDAQNRREGVLHIFDAAAADVVAVHLANASQAEGRADRTAKFMDAALLLSVPARYISNTGVAPGIFEGEQQN